MFVSLEFDADLVVVDTQVTVAVTNDCLRHHLLHLLRHDAHIGAMAAVIAEAIVAKAVGEMAKQDDVVFDRDVGAPSAATTAAAAATPEAAATATEAAGSHPAAAETSAADAPTSARRNNVRSPRVP
jgi:1-aminocyclopropane-1-carboxylate deaminase/D-cysteine desulfhydrase-like pyridoxal-dependent ACC family enzyme